MSVLTSIRKSVGREVFVTGYYPDTETEEYKTTIFPTKDLLKKELKYNNSSSLGEVVLVHGVVTKAESIPNEVEAGLDIFIVIPVANKELDSYIMKCDSINELQFIIEYMVSNNRAVITNEEADTVDTMFDIEHQEIDDIYVVYGYEINLVYAFDDEDIDEELIYTGKKIYDSIKQ